MAPEADRVAEFIELRSPEQRVALVCRYALRHYREGETVTVYAPDSELAEEIDGTLWTFRQNAFVPHVRLDEAEEPVIEPVIIVGDDPGRAVSDVLILAADGELPPWFERFPHLYDFAAVYDESLRERSRRRFARCKQAGYRMRMIRPGGS
ncbi:MAG: DNA polymerase III subunit chi [Planctomycetota bacterium]